MAIKKSTMRILNITYLLCRGFLCHMILVMLPYTHNLNIMYAENVIHEVQNCLHSCPYYFMH